MKLPDCRGENPREIISRSEFFLCSFEARVCPVRYEDLQIFPAIDKLQILLSLNLFDLGYVCSRIVVATVEELHEVAVENTESARSVGVVP